MIAAAARLFRHLRAGAAFACCVALLIACSGSGGGGSGDEPRRSTTRTAAVAEHGDGALDATAFLDWAERAYPAYFPGHQPDRVLDRYIYRHYPATGNYVGVADGQVAVLGPLSGGQLLVVGPMAQFRCQVLPASCAQPLHGRLMAHGTSSSARADDGTLLLWGNWDYPEGAPWPGSAALRVPMAVRQVLRPASGFGGVVLDDAGQVWAWGRTGYGNAGAAAITGRIDRPLPFPAPVRQIAEPGTLVALLEDGTVWAWENGVIRQIPGLAKVKALSPLSGRAVHIVRGDGTVAELVPWFLAPDITRPQWQVQPVAGVQHVLSMACAGDLCMALRDDFGVLAWGRGALGDGDYSVVARAPIVVPGVVNATQVAVMDWGGRQAMALVRMADGTLLHWGHLDGDGAGLRRTPAPMPGLPPVTEVTCQGHCLARAADGSVWGWGGNFWGELGDATGALSQWPPVQVPGIVLR